MTQFMVCRMIDPNGNVLFDNDGKVGRKDIECNFTYPEFNNLPNGWTLDNNPDNIKLQIKSQTKLYIAALKKHAITTNKDNFALIIPPPNAFIKNLTEPQKTTVCDLIINGIKEAIEDSIKQDKTIKDKLTLCLTGKTAFFDKYARDLAAANFGLDTNRFSVSDAETGSLIDKLEDIGLAVMDPSMGNKSAGQGNGATGDAADSGKDENGCRRSLGSGVTKADPDKKIELILISK